jgi:hypothetical protein
MVVRLVVVGFVLVQVQPRDSAEASLGPFEDVVGPLMLAGEKHDSKHEKRYAGDDGQNEAREPEDYAGPAQEFSPD